MKKHKSQMTEVEVDLLRSKVDRADIASIELTSYTMYRFNERLDGITLLDVAKVFLDYDLIEFNMHSDDKRVLLRDTKDIETADGCFQICLVYSIKNNRIVTVWLNNARDHQDTLRIEEYSEELEISRYI